MTGGRRQARTCRLAASAALELRLGARHGLFAVVVVVTGFWAVLLVAILDEARETFAPLVVFVDVATLGVFLLVASLLLERGEGGLAARLASPLRLGEYLGAKVAVYAGASAAAAAALALALVLAGTPARVPLALLAGTVGTAVALLLTAAGLAAPHRTLTGALVAIPWPLLPVLGVPLLVLSGVMEQPWTWVLPTTAGALLIRGGFVGIPGPQAAAATVWLCVGCSAAAAFALRRLRTHVQERGA